MIDELILKVAAKALIINNDGKVLLLREAHTYQEGTNTGRYQCPGGRLNSGESYKDGLLREVREETGLEVETQHPVFVGEWRPVIRGVPHHIIAIFTVCITKTNNIHLSEEHDSYHWVDPLDLEHLDITSADKEAIEYYNKSQIIRPNTGLRSICAE